MMLELVGSLIAAIYGGCTCFHKKVPLFYRILWYAGMTCLIGNIYTALYVFLWQSEDVSFHIGYLGYIGMFSSSFRLIMGRLIVLLMVSRQSSDGFGELQDLLQGSSWRVLHC